MYVSPAQFLYGMGYGVAEVEFFSLASLLEVGLHYRGLYLYGFADYIAEQGRIVHYGIVPGLHLIE